MALRQRMSARGLDSSDLNTLHLPWIVSHGYPRQPSLKNGMFGCNSAALKYGNFTIERNAPLTIIDYLILQLFFDANSISTIPALSDWFPVLPTPASSNLADPSHIFYSVPPHTNSNKRVLKNAAGLKSDRGDEDRRCFAF